MRFGRLGRKFVLAMLPFLAVGVLPPIASAASPFVVATVTPTTALEGQSVVVSAAIFDGSATHWVCDIDFGDGTSFQMKVGVPSCAAPAHLYPSPGLYRGQVTVTQINANPASGSTGFIVTYSNVAPTLSNPYFVEGNPYVSISDPGLPGESMTCVSADFGDGTILYGGTWTPNVWSSGIGQCQFGSHFYTAWGQHTVTLTVQDGEGATTSLAFGMAIPPLAPTVACPANSIIQQSGYVWHVDDTASFTDSAMPPAGPWSWSIDWEDGAISSGIATTESPIPFVHDYTSPGTYDVGVTVTDDQGVSASDTCQLSTANGPFTVVNTDPYPAMVYEGSPVTLHWQMSDGASKLPYVLQMAWGDGSVDRFISQARIYSLTHTYSYAGTFPEGAFGSTYTAILTVTDATGASSSGRERVVVLDAAPVVTSPAQVVVPEGQSDSVSLATFTDASTGPWQVSVSSPTRGVTSWTVSQPGPITIPFYGNVGDSVGYDVTVTDNGNMAGLANVQVLVGSNTPPSVGQVQFATDPVAGPRSVQASATFSDPALSSPALNTETYSCAVDYGDGSGPQPGLIWTVAGAQPSCSGPSHSYAEAGSYQATVTVADSNGGSGASVATTYSWPDQAPMVSSTVTPAIAAEPQTVVASATFSDDDSVSWTCTIDYGDNTFVAGTVSGHTCTGPAHHYAASGSYIGWVGITDDQGKSGAWIFTVNYTNTAPWIGGLVLVGDHRATKISHASVAVVDPGSAFETYVCTSIDYGDGSPLQPGSWSPTGWSDGLPRCVFPDHAYASPGTYTLKAVVTDGGGLQGTTATQETIYPFGPTVVMIPTQSSIDEGTSGTYHWQIVDALPGPYSVHVDWKDGTSEDLVSSSGDVTLTHAYRAADQWKPGWPGTLYEPTLTATDSGGQSGSADDPVFVVDLAPVIQAPATVPIAEGSNQPMTVTLATFSDASVSPWHVLIDSGSGTWDDQISSAPGAITVTYSAEYGNQTYRIVVVDRTGLYSEVNVPVVVTNASPIVTVQQAPEFAVAGRSIQPSFSIADPGFGAEGYTCTVDFGDGTGVLAGAISGSTCNAPEHAYQTAGNYSIAATVSDSNGGSGSVTVSINVLPTTISVATPAFQSPATEGTATVASATFQQLGQQTYTCTVDYGDGSGTKPGSVGNGSCVGPGHVYPVSGSFVVSVAVSGSYGISGQSNATLAVANVAPSVGVVTVPALAGTGTTVAASASFTDPGTGESYSVRWDWGDGTSSSATLGASIRSLSASHVYSTGGLFSVLVTVSDGSGSGSAGSAAIAVYDPGRSLNASGAFASPQGACTLNADCRAASTGSLSATASYPKAANPPNVGLTFKVAGLSFEESSSDWFVAGNGTAWISGRGKVNGQAGYTFLLKVVAGKPGLMAMTIRDASGNVVYSLGLAPKTNGAVVIK